MGLHSEENIYIYLQATTVAPEKISGRGGQVITDYKSVLTAEPVELLIFLAVNVK